MPFDGGRAATLAARRRGDATVRALWFSRSRRQACALIGERARRGARRFTPPRAPTRAAPQVMGFADTYFRSTVVWSLGADMALDGVVSKDRVPVSSYEATEDDPRDSKPEGEDWNEVDIAARQ